MKLLLTGFEPFAGHAENPSALVVAAMTAVDLPGVTLVTTVLPVDYQQGPASLLRAVATHAPEGVLCLGLAEGRPAICLEQVFVNLLHSHVPDNAGRQQMDTPIVAGGPAAYLTTLPAQAIVAAIRAAGIPAQRSLSAGAFLCNQVAYTLQHALAGRRPAVPAGFMHLPLLPAQAAAGRVPLPSMALEMMIAAVTIALRCIANGGEDDPVDSHS